MVFYHERGSNALALLAKPDNTNVYYQQIQTHSLPKLSKQSGARRAHSKPQCHNKDTGDVLHLTK